MKHLSFTHDYYLNLIQTLKNSQRPILTVQEFLRTKNTNAIILRHDVDRLPNQALRLARLEANQQIASTYYFRCHPQTGFPEQSIRLISRLGHEVGYHYETLSRANGKQEQALLLFQQNLSRFRQISDCHTVTAHGAPLSPHNNFKLLSSYCFSEVGLVGDGALSLRHDELYYFTDTGGRWNSHSVANFRDYVGQPPVDAAVGPDNLSQFAEFLNKAQYPIYLSTHPERWSHDTLHLATATLKDKIINLIKMSVYFAKRKTAS